MTGITRHVFRRGVIAGLVLATAATVAIASFFGSPSLAAHLGTSGKTYNTWAGPGAGAGGVDLQHLAIHAYDDSAGNIAGTVTFTADNAVSSLTIQRVRCEVRDPTVTSTWTVLTDVTAPDARISNSSPLNQFSDSFSFPNPTSGVEYKISVWDDATISNPRYVFSSGFTHP